ncbi:MAG: hypothetical protein JXA03_00275 [Bacteroidales bacterium]|nr:hypothetical protein [Bacteroidales bacterium]
MTAAFQRDFDNYQQRHVYTATGWDGEKYCGTSDGGKAHTDSTDDNRMLSILTINPFPLIIWRFDYF